MSKSDRQPITSHDPDHFFTMTYKSMPLTGRSWNFDQGGGNPDLPLVVGLHGGTYTSAYFDLPGYSLLARAAALGVPAIMLDRPGYGGTPKLRDGQSTISRNAEWLDDAIASIHETYGPRRSIVLVGHSIGGAITVSIAARHPSWPLAGIAISGVCLTPPPESGETWASLPELPMLELPVAVKDHVMFGPENTLAPGMPEASRPADAAIPREELLDIVTTWPADVRSIAAKVSVPIHFRQGEFDRLWVTDDDQVAQFGKAFSNAESVDAALFKGVGHCIDFHRLGASFQLEQLAFALRCGVAARDHA